MTKADKTRLLLAGICAVVSIGILYYGINFGQDLGGSYSVAVAVDKDSRNHALAVIKKRVEGVGLVAPVVSPSGTDRVLIRLARCDAAMIPAVERLCRETGLLSIHVVRRDNDSLVKELWNSKLAPAGYIIESITAGKKAEENFYIRTGDGVPVDQAGALSSFHATNLTPRSQFMLMPVQVAGKQVFRPCFVELQPELTNMIVDRAWTIRGSGGDWSVGVQLGREDKLAYREITAKHCPHGSQNNDSDTGRQFAVLVDNSLLAVTTIPAVVFDGRMFIDRVAGKDEATHLSSICQAGALRGVTRIEKDTIEPDLGSGVVRAMFLAVLLGGLAALVTLAAVWRGYGLAVAGCVAATVMLLPFGMILAAGILELISGSSGVRGVFALPVLTLWGLAGAGLALTTGLGLNVTIISRIADEMRAGRSLDISITGGYYKARWSIIDAAAVGLSAGILLFFWGTDPLKRFAVGLCAGTIVCLFVAFVVARAILAIAVSGLVRDVKAKNTTTADVGFGLVHRRLHAVILSVSVIVATWGLLIFNILKGRSLTTVPDLPGAVYGAVVAMLGVAVFVSIRFGLRHALGVSVAAIHAVLLAVGLFSLLGHAIGPAVAAALVVVAGCAICITLGIFDHVKELGLDSAYKRKLPIEVFGVAISRSIRHTIAICGAALLGAAALLIVCRGQVQDFGVVLFVGSLCASYSAFFIAVSVVLSLSRAAPAVGRDKR